MKNMLIADAGSTKTEWAEINGGAVNRFFSNGFNAIIHKDDDFFIPEDIDLSKIGQIHYYGSGVIDKIIVDRIKSIFLKKCGHGEVYIYDDLIAAARGSLGNKAGGIGILGTGSNSAYYDGNKLIKSIPALGYILGDEGGGVDIGKRIIRGYFYNEMPSEVNARFSDKYGLEKSFFLQELKNNPFPNRYLASFASFPSEIEGNWKNNLLLESFSSFFELRKNDFSQTDSNCFIGSIAYVYKDFLLEAAKNYNIKIIKIVKSPLEGLIKYHIKNNYG
jgi:hypothetical protein